MHTAVGQLPTRREMLERVRPVAIEYAMGPLQWRGEDTAVSNVVFGGIVGWLNTAFFEARPRHFTHSEGMTLRELLDQAYRAE